MKTLVIKMMTIGGRAVGRIGVNNSFQEHNSAVIKDILIFRIIEQVRTKCRIQE